VKGVLDEVHVADLLLRVVAVNLNLMGNLDDRVVLLVGEVEVHGGEHLAELLGRDLLMAVPVPVLEEALDVQTCIMDLPRAHAERVEALPQLLRAELLVGAVLAAAVAVAQL